jgi:hypothetical protein
VAGEKPDAIGRELGVTSMAVRQLVHRARVSVRAAVRVICPPPLMWMSRRAAAVLEKIPRAAGAPAGAAPAASKIAIVVAVSATVAAPATVIHSIFTHHPRPVHRSRVVTSRPATAASHSVTRRANLPSPVQASPEPQLAIARPPRAPSTAHAVRSHLAVVAPPRAPSAPKRSSRSSRASSSDGAGVSAWSPGSAPVGTGSGPGSASAGAPIDAARLASAATESSGGAVGPTASASASSPTDASATSVGSSSSTPTSTDASSPDQSATAGSPDASGTAAAGSATSP